jgi:hypothetical protein
MISILVVGLACGILVNNWEVTSETFLLYFGKRY